MSYNLHFSYIDGAIILDMLSNPLAEKAIFWYTIGVERKGHVKVRECEPNQSSRRQNTG